MVVRRAHRVERSVAGRTRRLYPGTVDTGRLTNLKGPASATRHQLADLRSAEDIGPFAQAAPRRAADVSA